MLRLELTLSALLLILLGLSCSEPVRQYDILVRGGTLYDGTGSPGRPGDVAILGDRIVAVGDLPQNARATTVIDATGLAVCPGFINMLSWANESLIADGRSMSDILQGVTLEVMGE
ncbi:MAG TPA: D-aminoacylase, partial [Candidatus Glassbacteria bacterium]|nr:D-aminoacylase [Candidatus Glassbacteria bacterium]